MTTAEEIKIQTAHNHQRLETQMYVREIFDKTLSLKQYCHLMQINYAVTAAIENRISNALPQYLHDELGINERIKRSALESDLKALGLNNQNIHQTDFPIYQATAEALGGMYVMEGATLGGNVIARHLKEVEALNDQPFHFYNIYGDTIREKWIKFIEVLNREVTVKDIETCIESANKTFEYYLQVAKKIIP